MKILVLSGSPKGEESVTLQSARYINRLRPAHAYEYVHVGLSVRALEQDQEKFAKVIEGVRKADLVLWCTPVYHLLVPAQLKRFIELVHERGAADAFHGKYAAALVTSIHFYDHTALNYLRAVSEDLGMHYFDGFPAEMNDLRLPAERKRLLAFADALFTAAESGRSLPRAFQPLPAAPAPFAGGEPAARAAFGGKRITVIADRLEPGSSLAAMVRRFTAACDGELTLVTLADLDIKGGCLGCCNCGFDNECSWDGKDGYRAFYEEKIKPAEVLVFAGTMTDRALSTLWKTYFDRSFYNTHIPVYRGKQLAWLVSGPLAANANLRQTMEVYPDFSGANLAGIVSDEGEAAAVGAALDGLAARLAGDLAAGYIRPQTFLGYAGMHLFRDDVFRGMRIVFRADHRWYKKHGVYKSLPHRSRFPRILGVLLGPVFAIPAVKRGFKRMIKAKMVEGHAAIVARGV